MAQPLKADFGQYVQFTNNYEERLLNFQVKNAWEIDIKPLLGDKLQKDIKSLYPFVYTEWSPIGSAEVGSYVAHEDTIYRVVSSVVGSEPAEGNGDYTPEGLKTFYAFYLLPFWVLSAYVNILIEAGRNLTQYGLVTPIESSNASQPISREDRNDLIKLYTLRKAHHRATLGSFLASIDYTIDGISYAPESLSCGTGRPSRDIGIRAVKKRRKYACGCYDECCCDNYRYTPATSGGNGSTSEDAILLE